MEWNELDKLINPARPAIKDKFLDLPKRVTVISADDITNLRIALGSSQSVEEFLKKV
jgi:hypothetical protein